MTTYEHLTPTEFSERLDTCNTLTDVESLRSDLAAQIDILGEVLDITSNGLEEQDKPAFAAAQKRLGLMKAHDGQALLRAIEIDLCSARPLV